MENKRRPLFILHRYPIQLILLDRTKGRIVLSKLHYYLLLFSCVTPKHTISKYSPSCCFRLHGQQRSISKATSGGTLVPKTAIPKCKFNLRILHTFKGAPAIPLQLTLYMLNVSQQIFILMRPSESLLFPTSGSCETFPFFSRSVSGISEAFFRCQRFGSGEE